MNKPYEDILVSIFIGLTTSIFLSSLYGWMLFTGNAEILSGDSIFWTDDETSVFRRFLLDKIIILGSGLFAAISLTSYMRLRVIEDLSHNEILGIPFIPKKKKPVVKKKKTPTKKKKVITKIK